MIEVEDCVKIINPGKLYTTYYDWAEDHGFEINMPYELYKNLYNFNEEFMKNWNVFAKDKHGYDTSNIILYGLKKDDWRIIIGHEGIKKTSFIENKQYLLRLE